MNELKATAGPWKILRGTESNRKAREWTADYGGETAHQEFFRVVSDETGDAVALAVYESDDFSPYDECQANAALIAAAPVMYEELKYHLEMTRLMPDGEQTDDFKRMDALLKKARGEA